MIIQEVECEFYETTWSLLNRPYSCIVQSEIILEDAELKIYGHHNNGKSNQDVEVIAFSDCEIVKNPQGLTKIFPNLKILHIGQSKLNSLERKDLEEYKDFIFISLQESGIKFLTGDLFDGMKNLEGIWLNDNKIEFIEPNLLDGLEKLKVVDLSGNICINKCYDVLNDEGNATLQEIKNEIREKFLISPWRKLFDRKIEHENGLYDDLKEIIKNENLKDFSVQVDDEEFKVHKFLLCARSPVLKEMIENNIDAECLKLTDISKEMFNEILNFIYTDELPNNDDINFVYLYAAAGRLKIKNLKKFAAEKLINEVNAENALEILTLANRYEDENLRQKSFELLKNGLGDFADKITDDLASSLTN